MCKHLAERCVDITAVICLWEVITVTNIRVDDIIYFYSACISMIIHMVLYILMMLPLYCSTMAVKRHFTASTQHVGLSAPASNCI